MDIQNELAQPTLGEPMLDYIKGSPFLCHEEHPPAVGDQLADQIRDSLALARPRWTDDHPRLAVQDPRDRPQLAGVGIHHQELLIGRPPVQLAGINLVLELG